MVTSSTEPVAFESALAELERILRALEDGSTSLEDSLCHYEQGVGLLKRCYQQLREAEQRIALLSGVDGDGRPALLPFDHAATFESPKPDEKRRPTRPRPRAPDGSY